MEHEHWVWAMEHEHWVWAMEHGTGPRGLVQGLGLGTGPRGMVEVCIKIVAGVYPGWCNGRVHAGA